MQPKGGIAQLGERCLCKADVVGSSPSTSTQNTKAADRIRSAAFFMGFSEAAAGRGKFNPFPWIQSNRTPEPL